MKALLPMLAVATALTAVSVEAVAQPVVPPLREELGAPPPPPGPPERYILEPGHWRWGPYAHRYVWEPRHWIGVRPGYTHFVHGHWEGGLWVPAHWSNN